MHDASCDRCMMMSTNIIHHITSLLLVYLFVFVAGLGCGAKTVEILCDKGSWVILDMKGWTLASYKCAWRSHILYNLNSDILIIRHSNIVFM